MTVGTEMNESKLQANIDALREFIQNNAWSIVEEKEIQSGYKLIITDGITRTPIALFYSGKLLIQGKPGELQTKLKTWWYTKKSRIHGANSIGNYSINTN
ncbi:MAG TPA: hypothetical protein VIX20_13380 [Ktedonobacteraceae bacterium]